jgi:hypothetical protein
MNRPILRSILIVLLVLNGLFFVSNIYVLGNTRAAIEMHEDLAPTAGPVLAQAKVICTFLAGAGYLLTAAALWRRRPPLALAAPVGFAAFGGLYLVELSLWGGSHAPVWIGFALFGGLGAWFALSGWRYWRTQAQP